VTATAVSCGIERLPGLEMPARQLWRSKFGPFHYCSVRGRCAVNSEQIPVGPAQKRLPRKLSIVHPNSGETYTSWSGAISQLKNRFSPSYLSEVPRSKKCDGPPACSPSHHKRARTARWIANPMRRHHLHSAPHKAFEFRFPPRPTSSPWLRPGRSARTSWSMSLGVDLLSNLRRAQAMRKIE